MPQRQPMSRALLLTILLSIQAAAADIATVVQQCEDCHGKNGVSDAADVPSIAGISAPVHGDFLLAYQEKTRPCRKGMCAVAAKLSATDIEAVANHFAKLPFVAAKQSFDAQKAAAGEKLHARDCAKCHTKGGRDPADDASVLGGQHLKYLQQALTDFKGGEREQSKKMAEKLAKWSDADIDAVAHYYASLQ